jgi:hypothetical protein
MSEGSAKAAWAYSLRRLRSHQSGQFGDSSLEKLIAVAYLWGKRLES